MEAVLGGGRKERVEKARWRFSGFSLHFFALLLGGCADGQPVIHSLTAAVAALQTLQAVSFLLFPKSTG